MLAAENTRLHPHVGRQVREPVASHTAVTVRVIERGALGERGVTAVVVIVDVVNTTATFPSDSNVLGCECRRG